MSVLVRDGKVQNRTNGRAQQQKNLYRRDPTIRIPNNWHYKGGSKNDLLFTDFKRVITVNKTTLYLEDDATSSYACTSKPPSIASKNSTVNNTCSVRDICRCSPAKDPVSCYCVRNNNSQILHLSNVLPPPISNEIVLADPKRLPIIWTKTFSFQLAIQINPKALQIAQEITNFTCSILPIAITGCYSCTRGGSFNTVHIRCTATNSTGRVRTTAVRAHVHM